MAKKCSKTIWSNWHQSDCKKPYFETVENYDFCKTHAKQYRLRYGLDTGESLEIRYFVSDLAITEFHGLVGKKEFTVRNRKKIFGDYQDNSKRIRIDDEALFTDLDKAKEYAKEWAISLLKELDEEIKEKSAFIASLE